MRLDRKLLFLFVSLLFVVGTALAQNVNRLVIEPTVNTGRYYCDFDININTENNGAGHTNCQYLVKFDTGDVGLAYKSRGSAFNATDTVYYTGVGSNILAVEEKNSAEITNSVTCSTLSLWNKTSDPGSIWLRFVDYWGNDPTSYDFTHTDDKLNLSLLGADTLTGVLNVSIPFEMCPCVLDSQAPFADTNTLSNLAINGGRLTGQHTISVLFVDDGGTAWGYWYSGLAINTGNYTNIGVPGGMDNQEGVNSGTIAVSIKYADSYGVTDDFFDHTSLSILAYTGNISNRPAITWDNHDRGYWLSFQNSVDYAVEQPVTIVITGYDNALLGNKPCITTPHMGTTTYSFNNFDLPVINNFNPVDGAIFVSPSTSLISFDVSDSWAGVNTGKVSVTISAVFSGIELLMTGYTYSGTELKFDNIYGSPGLGNAGGYRVSFVPKWEFPASTGIHLTGIVVDLAGYTGIASWMFTTRPSCEFYGCSEILDIFIVTGGYYNSGLPYQFTGDILIVTGTNPASPYPYLTGLDNDILMCGFPYTGTDIVSNFDLYTSDGEDILLPYFYTGHELYITGLDFVYQNGIIIID